MQVVFRYLLRATLATLAVASASCMVDSHGLGGRSAGVTGGAGMIGAAGSSLGTPDGSMSAGDAGSGALGG
ncbi:MAG: hypothetical protein JWM82_1757, partial [Myxococcales bacterium]|nr:hypothetical protein [Myxococcales bacterium]